MKKIIQTNKSPKALGPYSQAILSDNTLYVSGQLGLDPATGEYVGDTVELQAKKVMENLLAVLEEANMGFSNVVKCSIFLKDLSDFVKVNEIYGKCFPAETIPPARETVEVARLPKDALVEISAIAVK